MKKKKNKEKQRNKYLSKKSKKDCKLKGQNILAQIQNSKKG